MRNGTKKNSGITQAVKKIEIYSMEHSLSTKQIVLYISICFAAHCPPGHVLSVLPSLSVWCFFVNKSLQSTLCQTCSLGLSLAWVNTYLFLGGNEKLFDFCAGCSLHLQNTKFTAGYLPRLCTCLHTSQHARVQSNN